jgi:hypothetical protein
MQWWRMPLRRPHFVFDVQDEIDVARFLIGSNETLAARRLTQYLHDYFSSELSGSKLSGFTKSVD